MDSEGLVVGARIVVFVVRTGRGVGGKEEEIEWGVGGVESEFPAGREYDGGEGGGGECVFPWTVEEGWKGRSRGEPWSNGFRFGISFGIRSGVEDGRPCLLPLPPNTYWRTS